MINDARLADPAPSPLRELLEEHFSEAALKNLLGHDAATLAHSIWERALRRPVGDFVDRPGKAFRAALAAKSYEIAGGRGACPERVGAIVEILHAGSLIIDDIEDESSSRRGGPALHVLHGVPLALNAGNWMYFWALSLVGGLGLEPEVELALYQRAHRTLLRCHHGQGLDLTANVGELSAGDIPGVVQATAELKTGALMELAALLGAVAAGAKHEVVTALAGFGRDVGVALQMLDDVGGLLSEKRCHKGHEDLLLGRPTWPWAWLAGELSRERFGELQRLALRVQRREIHPELVARLLRKELRGSGRMRVRRHIYGACARLGASAPNSRALEELGEQLAQLEKSYV